MLYSSVSLSVSAGKPSPWWKAVRAIFQWEWNPSCLLCSCGLKWADFSHFAAGKVTLQNTDGTVYTVKSSYLCLVLWLCSRTGKKNCWAVIKVDEYCFWADVFCLSLCDLCTEVMVSRPERVTLNWFDGLMNSWPRSISVVTWVSFHLRRLLSFEKKRHNHLPLGKPDYHSS